MKAFQAAGQTSLCAAEHNRKQDRRVITRAELVLRHGFPHSVLTTILSTDGSIRQHPIQAVMRLLHNSDSNAGGGPQALTPKPLAGLAVTIPVEIAVSLPQQHLGLGIGAGLFAGVTPA